MQDASISITKQGVWQGGRVPLGASYGKLMMWFFLLSDAFTFASFLVCYGFFRSAAQPGWIDPELVFVGIPWLIHHGLPLVFVGIMTFILIFSSVTMVLAVEAGHRMDQKSVEKYMIYTIIGGAMFLGCQALEWSHLIYEGLSMQVNPFLVDAESPAYLAAIEAGTQPPFASTKFGQLFFAITGFHGFHVLTGVFILIITYALAKKGTLQKRGHYELVEKVGLYWHFVDLVWVFVFTLFYLI